MKLSRRSVISVISGLLPLLALNHAAYAGSNIKVSLWDKGATSMGMIDAQMPMGVAMSGARMGMATMGITADVLELPAGAVTFRVINESQEFYHSMVISRVEDPSQELPYLTDKMMVDEEAAGRAARVKE